MQVKMSRMAKPTFVQTQAAVLEALPDLKGMNTRASVRASGD